MNPEENDALWKLLGNADRKPEISPAFAQDVTRQVRQLADEKLGFWKSLFVSNSDSPRPWARPAFALGTLAAVAITAFSLLSGDPDPQNGLVQGDSNPVAPIAVPEESAAIATVDPVLEGFGDEMERIDQLDSLVTAGDVEDFADEEIAMLLF